MFYWILGAVALYVVLFVFDIWVYVIGNKLQKIWLDVHGWPIEFIMNRPIVNFIRWRHLISLYESDENAMRWYRVEGGFQCRGRKTSYAISDESMTWANEWELKR